MRVDPSGGRGPRGTRVEEIEGLPALWTLTSGDPRVCVAVLDGPADLGHPSFRGADLVQVDVLGRLDGAGGTVGPAPALDHGTHVAGVIFGQAGGPVRGVAPRCRGLIIPIYGGPDAGPSCSQADLARAIDAAVGLGADIISISGGEPSADGSAGPELAAAVRRSAEAGRLVVAAAGNEGCGRCLHVPGALPAVLAVGAMDERGEPLPSSNWGEPYRLRGILAPGLGVEGPALGGGAERRSGTSFATPIVSGLAALLLSLQLRAGRPGDAGLVRAAILGSGLGCGHRSTRECGRLLAGRLNLPGAVALTLEGAPTMAVPPDDHSLAPTAVAPPGIDPDQASAPPSPPATAWPDRATPRPRGGAGDLAPAVAPSGCGCGGRAPARQFVYAVGELGIDFGSRQRQDSIQEHFLGILPGPDDLVGGAGGPRPHPDYPSDIGTYHNFLRHLLGYDFPPADPAGQPYAEAGRPISNGNLYEAGSVYWVLKQGECPLYAIRPQGAFADAAYKQLIVFLIEQLGLDRPALRRLGIHTGCLEGFLRCYGGLQDDLFARRPDPEPAPGLPAPAGPPAEDPRAEGAKPERAMVAMAAEAGDPGGDGPGAHPFGPGDPLDLFGEDATKASHVAIAGEVVGKVRLYSGEEVEVLNPAVRGMSNWNTPRLILDIFRHLGILPASATAPPATLSPQQTLIQFLVIKVVARLAELTLNPGKQGRDRARNYFATTQLAYAARTFVNPAFLSMLGGVDDRGRPSVPQMANINVDDLVAGDLACSRPGSEAYDAELTFYNFANQFMGTMALAQGIDVSDVVPVASGKVRAYPKRPR